MLNFLIAPLCSTRRLALAALLLGSAAAPAVAAPPMALPQATTAYFAKFVDENGNVNYGAIKRNPLELKALVKRYETTDAKALMEADREAFYLNAYNILVISEVAAHYPAESVQKIPGFFDKNLVTVAGEKMTLNDLEAKKLREPFHDPRIHFAVNCASIGCPALRPEAYVAARLDAQLLDQTQRFLRDHSRNRYNVDAETLELSMIFKWYAGDFERGFLGAKSVAES